MRPKKRFGQHFLQDAGVLAQILRQFGARIDDRVLEIGPGEGALTALLAPQVKWLHVLEIDHDLSEQLMRDPRLAHVQVHCVDALRFPICTLAGDQTLRLIGNLPYNISTPLLFHFLEHRACIHDMLFMFQREVVERIVAAPGGKDYGRLSVMAQLYTDSVSLFDVPARAFRPPPKVESAVVRLVPRRVLPVSAPALPIFEAVVRQAFSQRRKTLRNSLRGFVSEQTLQSLEIDPLRRPETLSQVEFVRIAEAASRNSG